MIPILLLLACWCLITERSAPTTSAAAFIVVSVDWYAFPTFAEVVLARLGVIVLRATRRNALLLACIHEVHWLVIYVQFLHAAKKAGGIAQMPLAQSNGCHICRQSTHIEWSMQLQVLVGALVDNGAGGTTIHHHCDILLLDNKCERVVIAVRQSLKAEHCRYWVVASIIADSYTPLEQLNSQVLAFTSVGNDSRLVPCGQLESDVCTWPSLERFKLKERVLTEAHTRQQLTAVTCEARAAFAHIVGTGTSWLEADAVLAIMLLAGAGAWVQHSNHRCQLAVCTPKTAWTHAVVAVDTVHTSGTI